jgi:hypothetical protein
MPSSLKKRVSALEHQIAELKKRQTSDPATDRAWLDDLYGKFAGDPIFEQAMALGRKYRRSLRPKSGKTKRRSGSGSSTRTF